MPPHHELTHREPTHRDIMEKLDRIEARLKTDSREDENEGRLGAH